MIHPVKVFRIVSEAKVDVFLEFSCVLYDPMDVGNLISGSSAFLNPAWISGGSRFMYCWNIAWRILSITFPACEMSAIMQYSEHSLALSFSGIRMKTDLFQSCGHCWVFHICWHIECGTITASSFRIWNSSAGIPSPLLALFVVILPKAHLTSHSRMSGSRLVWVVTPLWLSGSWRSFCTVLLCILATSSSYLLLLLGPYHFCPLLSPSLNEVFPC